MGLSDNWLKFQHTFKDVEMVPFLLSAWGSRCNVGPYYKKVHSIERRMWASIGTYCQSLVIVRHWQDPWVKRDKIVYKESYIQSAVPVSRFRFQPYMPQLHWVIPPLLSSGTNRQGVVAENLNHLSGVSFLETGPARSRDSTLDCDGMQWERHQ